MAARVGRQYERFPYPPIPRIALPGRGQGETLDFERGMRLAYASGRSSRGIRILVAGCGTFEPVVVAGRHPRADEIVAVDLSAASLKLLRQRLGFARLTRRLAPVRTVQADLANWEEGRFDYIVASNLFQHVEDPAALLRRMAGWLAPGGILRIVVYPRASRVWMRETSRWLRWHGLGPDTDRLVSRARACMRELPLGHPLRSTFETQPETARAGSLVDAFFNAWEEPLSPASWARAGAEAGLRLAGEEQDEGSRSAFLSELAPELADWPAWDKLEAMDRLLELCANPVLWLAPGAEAAAPRSTADPATPAWTPRDATPARIPSRVRSELAQGLRAVEARLPSALSLESLLGRLRAEVGPRRSPPPRSRVLPGLAASDYSWDELRELPTPDALERWLAEFREPGSRARLRGAGGLPLPERLARTESLARQLEWVELMHGHRLSWIPLEWDQP